MKRINIVIKVEKYDDSIDSTIKGMVERINVSEETDEKEIVKVGSDLILKMLNETK